MTSTHGPAVTEHHAEHAHPGPRRYIEIAVALAVLTAIEIALSYIDIGYWLTVAGLGVLMVIKFALVAMFFMHLRFDNRLFTIMFVGGLVLAVIVFIAVLAIQRVLFV